MFVGIFSYGHVGESIATIGEFYELMELRLFVVRY